MKAGIYKTPNGNLIYIAKDRTIKATNLKPSSWPGMKVSHRAKDDTVLIEGTTYRCNRVADVPNGCTDPAAELHATELRLGEGKGYIYDAQFTPHAKYDANFVEPTAEFPATKQFVDAAHRMADAAKASANAFEGFAVAAGSALKDVIDDMEAKGFRFCHNRSARKHRKQGHEVRAVDGTAGLYAWRAQA